MKKKVLVLVGFLVALPLLLLGIAALFIDPIVRTAVERGAAKALKVPVRLDEASIRWRGEAMLGRFEVGNPAGYTEPKAVAFNRIDVGVRPRDLLGKVVHVSEVVVRKPEVTLEFSGTKNNLSALLDNLSTGRPPGGATAKKEGKKFLIGKVRIEEGTVRFKSDLLSGGTRSVILPSLDLENVGTAEGGATLRDILQAVIRSLAGAALKSGEGVLPAQLLESLRSGLRDLPARTVEELRRRAEEELKSRELDPREIERKLRERLQHKTAD